MDLHELNELPPALLNAAPEALADFLPGPTLVRIAGASEPPLFVSVLLHGNETTGLLAMQEYLKTALEQHAQLPRTLCLFIGNVAAAREGVRMLDGQADFNRIWSGGDQPEHRMAAQVLHQLRSMRPFAAIDIHNNTGRNPFYGCINRIGPEFLHLAGLFSPVTVYFTEPHEVISNACAALCPSVTLECGQVGETSGIGQIVHFLQQVMHLQRFHQPGEASGMTEVYHTVARIKIPEGSSITMDPNDRQADCCFEAGLDRYNFQDAPCGVSLARRKRPDFRLQVTDNDGRPCSDTYFSQQGEKIVTRREMVLAMLTPDTRVIAQDCFGYIMEHYPLPEELR